MFSKLIIGATVAIATAQRSGSGTNTKPSTGLSSDSKDSIDQTAYCFCNMGKEATGTACKIGGHNCVSCNTGYELLSNRCRPKCMISKTDTTKYCCNGKTYANFDTAKCGDGANFPICFGGRSGACENDCKWPSHDQASCNKASGCSWNTDKCEFATFSGSNTRDTCVGSARTDFQSGTNKAKFDVLKTALKACDNNISDDEIQRIRERAANKPGTSLQDYKAMMGFTNTDAATTDNANLRRQEGLKVTALEKMAEKCHSCMSASNPTKVNCENQAIDAFHTAMGANPPLKADIRLMLSTELPMAASAFALKQRAKCQLELDNLRTACRNRAVEMATTAACLLNTAVTGTDTIKQAEDLADQTLATECDSSTPTKAKACFDKRLEDLKEITGDDNIGKTDLKIRLQSVASEKAGAVMTACTDALIFCSTCLTKDVTNKRLECKTKARDEYKKYFDVPTMSIEEFEPILEQEGIKAGTSTFASCAKTNCVTDNTSKEITCEASKKASCMHKAIKKSAKFFGKEPKDFQKDDKCSSTTCAPNDQFEVLLKEAAVIAAADKKALCEEAKKSDANLDCEKEFKLALNAVTGIALNEISSKSIAEAGHKKNQEDAFKVMTAFQQDKGDCTKSADECLADLMTKTLGGNGKKTFDKTDVYQYKEQIAEKATKGADSQCREKKLSSSECNTLIKKAVKDATGIELKEDEIERKKAEGKRDVMAGFAATFYDGKTSEADLNAADDKMLAKFRETTGNSNFKKEDLFREQERIAEKKLAELLNSDGTTQEADIKAVIKEQTGRVPTDEELFQFKKAAAEKNSANVFLASASAGLSKEQREAKFIETLRNNLDISSATVLDGAVVEKYREGAKRKAIASIVDDQKIDVSLGATAIKTAKDSKLKNIQDTLKTINGKDADRFEAEAYLEDLAFENAMKTMTKQGNTKDTAKLLSDYKANTGNSDIELFELKAKIKRQAAYSPETLNKMKDSTLTLRQKKDAYKVEMEKIYGEKPNDAEVADLLNEAAVEKMFEVASARSKARGNKVATTADDIAKEKDARKTAYTETYGRPPTSDAEVEKTLKKAMASKVGTLFHKCRKSGTTEADCKTKLSTQFKDVDPNLVDPDEIKIYAVKEEQNSLAKAMKACYKEKTKAECLAKGKETIAAGRGESSNTAIKPYEVDKIMREGAKANLGSVISECDGDYYCKKAAMADFKEKTLDNTLTEEDFEAAVVEAAKKEGLAIAKACVPSATVDCGDIITKALIKANGGKKVKVGEAVTQIKDALPTDIATSLAACTKSLTECEETLKKKIKAAKPWDKRTGEDAEISPAEIKRAVKDGAIGIAEKTFASCRRLIDDNDADKANKEKECETAFDTDLKKYFPDAGNDADILEDAQKEARRRTCGTKIDAMVKSVNRTKADYKKKTRKEIRTELVTHLKKTAPGVDDKLTTNPAEVEKLIDDAALKHVIDAAGSCKELGDACKIAKDIKPSARRRSLMTADEQKEEDKKMRLGETFMSKSGAELEEKVPSKETEEKIVRRVGPRIIKRAVQSCVDAGTAAVNMTKCVLKEGRSIATMVRGDKKNDKKDYKDGIKADLRELMFKCLNKDGAKRPDCVKKLRDRLKITRDETDWPKKYNKKKDKAKDDETAAAEEAEEIVKDAAWKFASDESDLKRGTGPLDKADEKLVRDSRRLNIEKSGIDKREVDMYDMLGAELAIIKKGADMKRSGKADADIEKEVEQLMKNDEDSFDYTAKKKKEIKAAIDFTIEGDKKGDLKLKPMKEIYCRVCQEDKAATDFKIADVKKLVEDNAKAKAEIDVSKVEELEKPSKGKVSERSCGTVSYPPKPGKKAEDVDKAFSTLEKKARRALRMLIGRDLAEGTTSSGEVSTVVAGDDDSVATNPAADYTMLIVGVVIGCLCVVALAVLVYMAVNKKMKQKNAPQYKPHSEL